MPEVSAPEALEPRYFSRSYGHVVVFDFFMPVANEATLRAALDGLFYRDSVEARLARLAPERLARVFGEHPGETPEARIARARDWISDTFTGYSLSRVGGRFRARDLRPKREVVSAGRPDPEYLVDEPTWVVRFVFPVGNPVERRALPDEESIARLLAREDDEASKDEAEKVRWTFYGLFMEPVLRLAEGEDEIWLLESGYAHRLHKWVRRE